MKELRILTQLSSKEVVQGVLIKRVDQTPEWAIWLWIKKCLLAGIRIDHVGYDKNKVYTYAGYINRKTPEFDALMEKIF